MLMFIGLPSQEESLSPCQLLCCEVKRELSPTCACSTCHTKGDTSQITQNMQWCMKCTRRGGNEILARGGGSKKTPPPTLWNAMWQWQRLFVGRHIDYPQIWVFDLPSTPCRVLGVRFSQLAKFNQKIMDAAFLLTVGGFLLTVELFYLQLTLLAFLLTIGAFLLTVLASLLTVGAFLLEVGKCV